MLGWQWQRPRLSRQARRQRSQNWRNVYNQPETRNNEKQVDCVASCGRERHHTERARHPAGCKHNSDLTVATLNLRGCVTKDHQHDILAAFDMAVEAANEMNNFSVAALTETWNSEPLDLVTLSGSRFISDLGGEEPGWVST